LTEIPEDVPDWVFSPEHSPKRPGPVSELSDPQLHNRREQLVQVFEGYWGEIGRELQDCARPKDLIQILTPLEETYVGNLVAVFRRASSESGSTAEVHKIRKMCRKIVTARYAADQSYRKDIDDLQRVSSVLQQPVKSSHRIAKAEQKKRRKEIAKSAYRYQQLSKTERDLERRLQDVEAGFAREQIFLFLESDRYELTPLTLANAAAGLPYMGWRRSMDRCRPCESNTANGLMFQVFKAIRYTMKTAPAKDANQLVAYFRALVLTLPSRHRLARTQLASDWWYLERSIRQALRSKVGFADLHFEIFKYYARQIRNQSQIDRISAEHAKLQLQKRRKLL
jgi:hypothetical protein